MKQPSSAMWLGEVGCFPYINIVANAETQKPLLIPGVKQNVYKFTDPR
jgi:hypothetical protein